MKKPQALVEQLGAAGLHGPRRPHSANTKVEPTPAPSPSKASKVSVSLYPTDLIRLDEIKEFMQRRGFRNLSDSEALRLACRAVEIGDRFIEIYQSMQGEDRRVARRIVAK